MLVTGRHRHMRIRLPERWCAQSGQAFSEYVTLLGFLTITIVACLTLFISPVAYAYVRLFRRLVLYMTGGS